MFDYYIPKIIVLTQSTSIVGYYTYKLIPILNPTVVDSKLERIHFIN
jgi:hypothetical protein